MSSRPVLLPLPSASVVFPRVASRLIRRVRPLKVFSQRKQQTPETNSVDSSSAKAEAARGSRDAPVVRRPKRPLEYSRFRVSKKVRKVVRSKVTMDDSPSLPVLCATCCRRVAFSELRQHWTATHYPKAESTRMYCIECHDLITFVDELQRHETCFMTEAARCTGPVCSKCQYHATSGNGMRRHKRMFHQRKKCGYCGIQVDMSWRMKSHELRCCQMRYLQKHGVNVAMALPVSSNDGHLEEASNECQNPPPADSSDRRQSSEAEQSADGDPEVVVIPPPKPKVEQLSSDEATSDSSSEADDSWASFTLAPAPAPTLTRVDGASTSFSRSASSLQVQDAQVEPREEKVDLTEVAATPVAGTSATAFTAMSSSSVTSATAKSCRPSAGPNQLTFVCTICGTITSYRHNILRHLKFLHRVPLVTDDFIEVRRVEGTELPAQRTVGCQTITTSEKCNECQKKDAEIKQLRARLKKIVSIAEFAGDSVETPKS